MHYKNGREAKDGDKIMSLEHGAAGVLHSTNAGAETCNGRMATVSPNDPWVTLSRCLHVDDIAAADVPDSSAQ